MDALTSGHSCLSTGALVDASDPDWRRLHGVQGADHLVTASWECKAAILPSNPPKWTDKGTGSLERRQDQGFKGQEVLGDFQTRNKKAIDVLQI